MAVTEIILKENVPGLGAEADVVKVRSGYARNHLIPANKAYEVTPANLKRRNTLKAKRTEREARELNEAQEFARKLSQVKLDFVLETGETGKAFGSVTAKDIEDKLRSEFGIEVDRHKIELERPIKESGEKEIEVKFHRDVTATLKVDIKSSKPAVVVEESAESADSKAKTKRRSKAVS